MGGGQKKGGARPTDLEYDVVSYIVEIKILRKLRYCTVKNYHTDHTDDTFIVLSTTVYRRFSFLRTILAASVYVSTTKFIFTSYFLWPISLKKCETF
jgi:hypothetical protein